MSNRKPFREGKGCLVMQKRIACNVVVFICFDLLPRARSLWSFLFPLTLFRPVKYSLAPCSLVYLRKKERKNRYWLMGASYMRVGQTPCCD